MLNLNSTLTNIKLIQLYKKIHGLSYLSLILKRRKNWRWVVVKTQVNLHRVQHCHIFIDGSLDKEIKLALSDSSIHKNEILSFVVRNDSLSRYSIQLFTSLILHKIDAQNLTLGNGCSKQLRYFLFLVETLSSGSSEREAVSYDPYRFEIIVGGKLTSSYLHWIVIVKQNTPIVHFYFQVIFKINLLIFLDCDLSVSEKEIVVNIFLIFISDKLKDGWYKIDA